MIDVQLMNAIRSRDVMELARYSCCNRQGRMQKNLLIKNVIPVSSLLQRKLESQLSRSYQVSPMHGTHRFGATELRLVPRSG